MKLKYKNLEFKFVEKNKNKIVYNASFCDGLHVCFVVTVYKSIDDSIDMKGNMIFDSRFCKDLVNFINSVKRAITSGKIILK